MLLLGVGQPTNTAPVSGFTLTLSVELRTSDSHLLVRGTLNQAATAIGGNALFINVGAYGQTVPGNCGVGAGNTYNGGQINIVQGTTTGVVDCGAIVVGSNTVYNINNGGMNITQLDGITINKVETQANWVCGVTATNV